MARVNESSKAVREQRLRRGWTQDDLAALCINKGVPVSRAALSNIERGGTPRPRLRVALAELLDIDIAAFDQPATDEPQAVAS